jgi:hypothetical protein
MSTISSVTLTGKSPRPHHSSIIDAGDQHARCHEAPTRRPMRDDDHPGPREKADDPGAKDPPAPTSPTSPTDEPESCDWCGSTDLWWRNCKLLCRNCSAIVKSCNDL